MKAYGRHVLPPRMHRVRFAGLFRAKGRQERMQRCRELMPSRPQTNDGQLAGFDGELQQSADPEEPDPLEEGSRVLCDTCRGDMQLAAELDGPTSCWLLQVVWLLATWLRQHPGSSVRTAIVRTVRQLQDQAGTGFERLMWATLNPRHVHFVPNHLLAFEAMLLQQLATTPRGTLPAAGRPKPPLPIAVKASAVKVSVVVAAVHRGGGPHE